MMKKRLLGFVLALVLALSLIPTTALAVATTGSGTFGSGMKWALDGQGTLTISGTGSMDTPYVPWAGMRDSIKSLVICDGVTDIGNAAFKYCKNLTTVTIPGSVQRIGSEAFLDCQALKRVVIPEGVKTIGESAFLQCAALSSVTISNTVTTICEQAFAYCTSLTSVTIPDNVKYIHAYAFRNCTGLKSAVISKKITTIAEELFAGCTSLTAFTIPSGVTSIGKNAFTGCTSLTAIHFPSSVARIEKNAFNECSNLQKFTAGTASTTYSSKDGVLYNKDKTVIALFPNGYSGSYTIPSTVSTIGDYTFDSCKKLTSVESIAGLKRIGTAAFVNCKALKTVKLPRSLTSIGNMAFAMCDSLSSVTFLGGAPTFTGTPFYRDTATVYYPVGNSTWTSSVRQNYGGTLTWKSSTSAALSLTVSCTVSTGKPKLAWNAISGAAKYEVYRATSKNGTYSRIFTTTGTSFTNTGAVAGTAYYYKVRPIYSSGKAGGYSSVRSITCDCARPEVVVACNATTGKPVLTWSTITGADKYYIYRSTNGTDFNYYNSTTNTSYTNTSTTVGSTYYYKVKAVSNKSSSATSAYSTAKNIVCDCARPVVSITLSSSGKPKLSWNAVTGADKYYIYRSTNGTDFSYYDSTVNTSYTNTSTTVGSTYYYKVKALSNKSSSATSTYSAAVHIKTTK